MGMMGETSGSRGERRATVERAFAHPAFASSIRAGAPSVLLFGAPLDLVWANGAGAAVFEVRDCGALAARLLGSSRDTARRLAHLAATLVPGAAPRLERLRFTWGFTPRIMTVLCARPEGLGEGPALALVMAGVIVPGEVAGRWHEEAAGPAGPFPLPSRRPVAATPVVVAAAAITPPAPDDLGGRRAALRAATGGGDHARFVWRTDAGGRVVEIGQALLDGLGLDWHPRGLSLAESAAAHDAEGAVALRAALARQATFSGLDLDIPLTRNPASGAPPFRLPVALGGSPVFDGERRFGGYRGFGRIDLARLHPAPAPGAEAPQPHAEPAAEPPVRLDPTAPDAAPDATVDATPATDTAPVANIVPVADTTPVADIVPEARPAPVEARPARSANVVPLRPLLALPRPGTGRPADGQELSDSERVAFQEIGRALNAVVGGDAAPREVSAGPLSKESAETPREAPPEELAETPRAMPSAPHPEAPGAPSPAAAGDPMRHAAALVDATTAGLLVLRQPRVLFANDTLRASLGYEDHQAMAAALGLHFARHPPPGAPDGVALPLPDAFGDTLAFTAEARPFAWEGEPAVLWTLSRPAAAGTVADRDPPPKADDALRGLVDAAGEAIAALDENGRVLARNRLAGEWFGEGGPDGETFAAILTPESRAAFTAALAAGTPAAGTPVAGTPAGGEARAETRLDLTARRPGAAPAPVRLRLTHLAAGRFAVAWRDLSAERDAEWELARIKGQIERTSGQQPEFLAKVSHEIRTPLNAILGFTEIMVDERFGPLGNPRYKDYLQDIHAAGVHVMKLVNDLLDLSRIETGRLDLDLGAVDVNKIIAECVAQGQANAHRKRVIVRTSLGQRLPTVMADDRSARQIIANVLANAVKFNEPGGQVIVSSAAGENGTVVVRIRDTGIGMSDAEVAAALEPFRQFAPAKGAGGTGLGLPLTKALAVANGASLSIRSRPREGTLVEVTFQAAPTPAARVPA